MTDWPSTLPKPRDGSLQEGRVAAYVSDQGIVGAARRRARFTRTRRTFGFSLVLTTAQKATLETFIDTTTDGGVSEFNWTHPETAVIYEVRFAELPQFQHATYGVWAASIAFEEI